MSITLRSLTGYLAGVRTLNRSVHLFLATTACRGMVIAMLSTLLNLYLYSLGYGARFIGLINASNALAVLLVSVPLGYVADRFGRRPVLLAGGFVYPFCLLAVALAHSTALILAFNFLFGIFSSAYWVAGIPLLFAYTTSENRVRAFSFNSFLLWGFGPLGAFVGGQVVEIAAQVEGVSASSSAALRVGLFFVVAIGALGALPYPWLREPPRGEASEEPASPRAVTGLFTRLLVPDLVLAFGLGAVLTFAQLYFHLRFGLAPGSVGVALAIGGLAAGVGALITPAFARRWGNLRTTVRAQWTAAPMIAVVAISTRLPLSLAAYWLVLMLRGMADPVYTAFAQERVPAALRARLTGLYSVTYSIGYSLGPAASGQLQQMGGFTPAFLLGAAGYAAGATLLFLFFRTRPAG